MPSVELFATFFVACAVFAFLPGPSMLYVASQTMASGRSAGWSAALGLYLGGCIHVLAATLGLSILFETMPVLHLGLKFLGALYLMTLGVGMLIARAHAASAAKLGSLELPRRTLWQSVTVAVLNPKLAVFYIVFLPQFVEAEDPIIVTIQILIMGMLANIVFTSAKLVCVLAVDRIRTGLGGVVTSGHAARRLCGVVMLMLGMHLGIST